MKRLLLGGLALQALAPATVVAAEHVAMKSGDVEVLRYQAEPLSNPQGNDEWSADKFRADHFIHPLRTPSGFVVSESNPKDHPHHFGLWWPWKHIQNGDRNVITWDLQTMQEADELQKAFAAGSGRKFFAFDNGLTDVASVEEQAKLLKDLGYDGVCVRPETAGEALLAAFDEHGVTVSATYVVVGATGGALPRSVIEHITSLKGRDTIIWLALTDAEASDEKAVATIRAVYELAKANGLKVVLYPHVHFRTDTIERTEHLRELADCPDLGISFNLCHFLAQTDEAKLEETVKAIAPHLGIVQVSGANRISAPEADWSQLILPLGEGNFEMERVVRTLDEIGYEGPIGLQCYQIALPAAQHLRTSINAWRKYNDHP